jgi:hypothetical protein
MKKLILVAVVLAVLATSFFAYSQVKAQPTSSPAPSIVVSPLVNAIDRKGSVVIMGSGFKAKQEVNILFYDAFGSIGALEEPVKADDHGNWVMLWALSDYARGVLPDGPTSIMAADASFNVIASAPVVFVDTSKDWEKWPAWGKAALPKPKATPTPTPKATPAPTPKP